MDLGRVILHARGGGTVTLACFRGLALCNSSNGGLAIAYFWVDRCHDEGHVEGYVERHVEGSAKQPSQGKEAP